MRVVFTTHYTKPEKPVYALKTSVSERVYNSAFLADYGFDFIEDAK